MSDQDEQKVTERSALLASGSSGSKGRRKKRKATFGDLFKYATNWDKLRLASGVLCAVCGAILLPIAFFTAIRVLTDMLSYEDAKREAVNGSESLSESADEMKEATFSATLSVACLMVAIFLLKALSMYIFGYVSVCIIRNLRLKYVHQLLSLDIAWSNKNKNGDLTAVLEQNLSKVSDALENNIPLVLMQALDFFFSLTLAMLVRWDLALLTAVLTIPSILLYVFGTKYFLTILAIEDGYLARAAQIATECFQAIKTVICFNGQRQTIQRYEKNMETAMHFSHKRAVCSSVIGAFKLLWADTIVVFGMWYGAVMLGDWDPGLTLGVVFCFHIMFSSLMPVINLHTNAIFVAMGSALEINKILEIKPAIEQQEGQTLETIGPKISFQNVSFCYPSRETVVVINDFSLNISPGDKIAIVGPSGCGKSTIAALLMRFFNPTFGTITLDGEPLQMLDVKWLRQQLGYVSQEPVLFNMTIRENIQCAKHDATETQIVEAIKLANAYDFVKKLPEFLDTCVGEGGAQLSGGEKQRLAIARALVRNPCMIIFDESTSALDSESEAAVLEAMNMVSKVRTTVTIAHRLSTIMNSDRIVVMDNGSIIEYGAPQELIDDKGTFYKMLQQQEITQVSKQPRSALNRSSSQASLGAFSRSSSYANLTDLDLSSSSVPPQNLMSKSGLLMVDVDKEKNDHLTPSIDSTDSNSKSASWAYKYIFSLVSCTSSVLCHVVFLLIFLAGIARAVRHIVFIIVISWMLDSYSYSDPDELWTRANYGLLAFFIGEILGFIGELGMYIPVPKYSDKLSSRIGSLMLTHYLSQNMAYFDQETHNSGTLSATLSTHPANIRETISSKSPEVVTVVLMLLIGLTVSLCMQPYMALFAMSLWVMVVVLRAVEMKVLTKQENKLQPMQDNSIKLVSEALRNLETVKAYSLEEYFAQRYDQDCANAEKQQMKKIVANSCLVATADALRIFTLSLNLLFGGFLMRTCDITVFRWQSAQATTQACLIRLLMVLTQNKSFARSLASFKTVAKILNESTPVDYLTNAGVKQEIRGDIKLKNVTFNYPARSQAHVFEDLDLHVKPRTTIAIVGSSGCGKSSVMNLILRLYEPNSGAVQIDGIDISSFNPTHLHNNIVPVSQEPILFSGSIWENICYGLDSHQITPAQVFNAAISANIHEFIQSLPEKYSTQVGDFGAQLSGGQKQRIAIARALIRQAPVLLLDEATAALDTANEVLVQSALEEAQQKCTCITIAHRLSTICNASLILVMEEGQIVEKGTHKDLISSQGLYYRMCEQQKAIHD